MVDYAAAKEVDLHNMTLFDAEMEICENIEESWYAGKRVLLLIHGYNNGVAIRDFIRNAGRLRKKLKHDYSYLPEVQIVVQDHGSTYVILMEDSSEGGKKIGG